MKFSNIKHWSNFVFIFQLFILTDKLIIKPRKLFYFLKFTDIYKRSKIFKFHQDTKIFSNNF